VRDELLAFHKVIPTFLEVLKVRNVESVRELLHDLDLGEAEAIVLAHETGPDYLLIDDLAARSFAIAKGLPVIGLLGVLVKAKRSGLIVSLEQTIIDLERRAGFRISPHVRIEVLAAGGESSS
jgi:predicted nucleic acid-binding protein